MTKPENSPSAVRKDVLDQLLPNGSRWDTFFDVAGVDLGPRDQPRDTVRMQQGRSAMGEHQRDNISLNDLIVSHPDVMGGRRVFRGTRVPVEVLFENLADGMSLGEILSEYETLNRDDVVRVLEFTSSALATSAAA